jgi:hypothetical protein
MYETKRKMVILYSTWTNNFCIFQMALIFMPQESSHSGTVLIIFLLAGCLSYSNSTMNPILYAFLSENFKKSFKKACHCSSEKVKTPQMT